KTLTVTTVEKTKKRKQAPGLYDLTELQRDANKRFGFSAKETLNIMQRLYEHHKVLTYPRTDSRYIGSDVADTLKDRLRACGVGPYKKLAGALIRSEERRVGKECRDTGVAYQYTENAGMKVQRGAY